MPKIAVILGSTREGRFGEKPARWIYDEVSKRPGVTAELLDLRDYPLPLFDQPSSPAYATGPFGPEIVQKWSKKIAEADGYIITAAEYNHGYTAVLKNAFDWLYHEWANKPVGFVGYGGIGGGRAIEQLRLVAVEVQMAPIRHAVHLPWPVYESMMKLQAPVDPALFAIVQPAADLMIDQLLWWTEALKAAREKK